jgi:glycosyltransferase involved in cell wall biosynthesis
VRIAIVSTLFAPYELGGAEQVAAQVAEACRAEGHTVDIISTARRSELDGRAYKVDQWNGMRVWRIAPWNLYWRFDKELDQPGPVKRALWHLIDLWNPSVVRPLGLVLDQIRPDVVNTHNIDGFSLLVWKVGRKHTRAIAHTLHDYHLICPRAVMQRRNGTSCETLCHGCRIYANYNQTFQNSVNALIAPAQVVADVHRLAGWTKPRMRVIPNAVEISETQHPESSGAAPLQVVFMSRLVPEKGCETLLNVIDGFKDHPEVHFHVAGKGPYQDRFARISESAANFTWHGHVGGAHKAALLSQGDVFLQLSEWRENAPLSLLEARLHGLFLIGTDMGGIPEIIGSPAQGCLIRAADADGLRATLQEQIANRSNLRSQRPIRREQNQGYTVRDMGRKYLQLFASVARGD